MSSINQINNSQDLKLGLESTLQELPLWDVLTQLDRLVSDLIQTFEDNLLLPGIILTTNQQYIGMISRRKFFEHMSRPYSLELFSKRPIEMLYEVVQTPVLILAESTSVKEATQTALQRSLDLVYEPIVVKTASEHYQLLDVQQLLLAYSQIHILTLNQLKKAEKQTIIARDNLRKVQENYIQLVQYEKMTAIGQLVSSISQEINNPANFITGSLIHTNRHIQELLQLITLYQKHYPTPPTEIQNLTKKIDLDSLITDIPKLVDSMKVGSKRIQQIIRSLLNFSHFDETEIKAVDIHENIDATLLILQSRLQPQTNIKKIAVIKEYGNIPLVECYIGQINQVFLNILGYMLDKLEENLQTIGEKEPENLIKAQSSSFIIRISTNMMMPQNHLEIRIADNGTGMTEEVRQEIFDPLFNTQYMSQGKSVGLSICRNVVEKHGGKLQCISSVGKGTEFVIQIPVRLHQQS